MVASTTAAPSNATELTRPTRDPWFFLARAVWAAVTILIVLLFIIGAPVLFRQLETICSGAICHQPQLSPLEAQTLQQHGLSLRFYATYFIALEAVYVLSFCAIAALIVRHCGRDRWALFGATMLVLFGGTAFTETTTVLEGRSALGWWLVSLLSFFASAMLVPFFYRFPDGRSVPRWTQAAAIAWVAVCLVGYFSPANFPLNQDPNNPTHLFPIVAFGFIVSVLVAQADRYRHTSSPVQRQQTKWVAFGFIVAFTGFFIGIFIIEPRIANSASGSVLSRFLGLTNFYFFLILVPLSLGMAILRQHLWGIDILINRTLVYGALTVGVVAMYAIVVGGSGMLFETHGNLFASLIATALVAVLFQPVREWLQRGANHLVYGERDEPYTVLSRLSLQLEATLTPDAVLPTIVQTVADALKLPFAAITVVREGEYRVAASCGTPEPNLLRLPLTYGHEVVGELTLAPRAPETSFSSADRQLLTDLARQAGIATHAVLLTADLERSRERIVSAREAARRRLGSDLHDGLGHRLAAIMRQAETASNLLTSDLPSAQAKLADLVCQARGTLEEVRGLAHSLHPPELELLGLIEALRERAQQYSDLGERHLRVEVDACESLPPLPVAVEAAAYYIALEALNNMRQHAAASHCAVRLAIEPCSDEERPLLADVQASMLVLEVIDDGCGFDLAQRPIEPGLGISSMRERATELGGTFAIESLAAGGTRVCARLPVMG